MRPLIAVTCLTLSLGAPQAYATSVRNVHTELAGITQLEVAVNSDLTSGVNDKLLATAMTSRLGEAGITSPARSERSPFLYVRVRAQASPTCSHLYVSLMVAVREFVPAPRAPKDEILVTTWSEFESFTASNSAEAGQEVHQRTLAFLTSLTDDIQYATEKARPDTSTFATSKENH